MGYIEGEDRKQTVLFPEVLDDYISEENAVRFIDVFIEGLDLSEMGFGRAIPKETGRPPYDPGDLLRLYVCVCVCESDTLESAVGERSGAQCGVDVADAQAQTGF